MSFPKANVRPEVLPAIEVNKPLSGVDPVHRQVSQATMSAHAIAPYRDAGVGYRAYVVAQSDGGAEQDNANVGGSLRGQIIEYIKDTARKLAMETGEVPSEITLEAIPCSKMSPTAAWAKLGCTDVLVTAKVSPVGDGWDIEVTVAANTLRVIPGPGGIPRPEPMEVKRVTYQKFPLSKPDRRS